MATAENVFPKIGGDPLYASEVNKFNSALWKSIVSYNSSVITSILAHDATNWTRVNGTSTLITSNSGTDWTAATTDIADMTGVSRVCIANKVKAISCDHDSGNISITADSGVNWTAATTDPAAITRVWDLSFPTATCAVVGCDLGAAARGIFFSTDAGDTWTICTSGPAVDVFCIDMIDGSDGIAIDVNGNIWTTGDGGDNWTDSGQNVINPPSLGSESIIALTATTGVYYGNTELVIETFNTTSGGTVRLSLEGVGETLKNSNLIKITDGNIYFMVYNFVSASIGASNSLFRSIDGGVNWSEKLIGINNFDATSSLALANNTKSLLIEYDTNKLLFISGDRTLMTLDVS